MVREFDLLLQKNQARIAEEYLPARLAEGEKFGWSVPGGWFFPQRPLFFPHQGIKRLEDDLSFLFQTILDLPSRLFQNDLQRMGEILRIPEETIDILSYFFPRGKGPFLARPDCIWNGTNLSCLETNIECTLGGLLSMEFYIDYFEGLPFWADFAERNQVKVRRPWSSWISSIKGWLSSRPAPVVYLAPHRKNDPELALIPERMKEAGIPLVMCEPEDLVAKGDRLFLGGTAGGGPVSGVFTHVTALELFSEYPRYAPILHVASQRGVFLLKELVDLLFEGKGLLPLFYDDRFASGLDSGTLTRIRGLIPRTIWVEEKEASHIQKEKDHLVLKAPFGLQGQSVWLGDETEGGIWSDLVDRAVEEGGWIAQERVSLPQTTLPYFLDGKLEHHTVGFMPLPFYFDGAIGGFAVRTSIPEKSLKLTFPEHGNTGVTALFEI